jgi:hypothetical protein
MRLHVPPPPSRNETAPVSGSYAMRLWTAACDSEVYVSSGISSSLPLVLFQNLGNFMDRKLFVPTDDSPRIQLSCCPPAVFLNEIIIRDIITGVYLKNRWLLERGSEILMQNPHYITTYCGDKKA